MKNKPGTIELEPVIWWGIDSKNLVSKFDSPEKKKKVSYWIKQTDLGERYTTSYGNTYEIYQYAIFDKRLNDSEIVFNNWKIRRIYDPKGKNAYNYTKAEYVDPTGIIHPTIQFAHHGEWQGKSCCENVAADVEHWCRDGE